MTATATTLPETTTPVAASAPRYRVQPVELEVTNTCQCAWCPECNIGYTGADYEPCEECGETIQPLGCCDGACIDEYLPEVFAEWLTKNRRGHGYFTIEGSGMGWRHLSGSKTFHIDSADAKNPMGLIGVNSQYTQTWTIRPVRGGACEASQSHHDAMGEAYTVRPATAAEARDARWY